MPASDSGPSRRYAKWLWGLFALFAFRVAAQPAALLIDHPLLPRFESWHSAALPYGVLLGSQVLILTAFGWAAWRFTLGGLVARRRVGIAALALGGLYFAAMVVRLIFGLSMLRHLRWFASPLPTVFHLALAAFVLLCGHFHYVHAADSLPDRKGRHGLPSG